MPITKETRWESYKSLLYCNTIHGFIVNELKKSNEIGLTAREVAIRLYNQGFIKSNTRQATAPRLTELVDSGIVDVVGKRFDNISGKNVAVYKLKKSSS